MGRTTPSHSIAVRRPTAGCGSARRRRRRENGPRWTGPGAEVPAVHPVAVGCRIAGHPDGVECGAVPSQHPRPEGTPDEQFGTATAAEVACHGPVPGADVPAADPIGVGRRVAGHPWAGQGRTVPPEHSGPLRAGNEQFLPPVAVQVGGDRAVLRSEVPAADPVLIRRGVTGDPRAPERPWRQASTPAQPGDLTKTSSNPSPSRSATVNLSNGPRCHPPTHGPDRPSRCGAVSTSAHRPSPVPSATRTESATRSAKCPVRYCGARADGSREANSVGPTQEASKPSFPSSPSGTNAPVVPSLRCWKMPRRGR